MARKPMIATEYKVVYETHDLAIDDSTFAKILDDYAIYWYGQDEYGELLPEWTISATGLKNLLAQIQTDNDVELWLENISLKDIEYTIQTILKYGYVDENDNVHIMW